jgi:hypothetical protein
MQLGGGSALSGGPVEEMTLEQLQEKIRKRALEKQQQILAEQLEAERKSKNASTASGATKDGNKQIGVVRKKRSKEDDSEDDSLRKLKAGSALSSSKAQP